MNHEPYDQREVLVSGMNNQRERDEAMIRERLNPSMIGGAKPGCIPSVKLDPAIAAVLPSRFQIDDRVLLKLESGAIPVAIVGVYFNRSKVSYDVSPVVDDRVSAHVLQGIDSINIAAYDA